MSLFSNRTHEEWTGNRGERGNDKQQRATGGIEPMAAAARPLYMGGPALPT